MTNEITCIKCGRVSNLTNLYINNTIRSIGMTDIICRRNYECLYCRTVVNLEDVMYDFDTVEGILRKDKQWAEKLNMKRT